MKIELSQDQLNQIHIAALALEIDSEYAVQAVLDEALRSYAEHSVATHEMRSSLAKEKNEEPLRSSLGRTRPRTFQIHRRRGR